LTRCIIVYEWTTCDDRCQRFSGVWAIYSNTMIGTLAVNGWAVTFGTAMRGLRTGRGRSPTRPLLAVQNVTAHPSTASVPTSYCSVWHYKGLTDFAKKASWSEVKLSILGQTRFVWELYAAVTGLVCLPIPSHSTRAGRPDIVTESRGDQITSERASTSIRHLRTTGDDVCVRSAAEIHWSACWVVSGGGDQRCWRSEALSSSWRRRRRSTTRRDEGLKRWRLGLFALASVRFEFSADPVDGGYWSATCVVSTLQRIKLIVVSRDRLCRHSTALYAIVYHLHMLSTRIYITVVFTRSKIEACRV